MTADFTFGEEQLELQRAARRLFEERASMTAVREAEHVVAGFDRELWAAMSALGWVGMGLPSHHGGGGGDFLDLYALFEEMGRFLVPSPLLETFLAAEVLRLSPNVGRRDEIVPHLASGERLASVAVTDAGGTIGRTSIVALGVDEGWRLNGSCPLVPFASSADHLLCAADDGGDLVLFLVDPSADGLVLDRLPNIAGMPLYSVSMTDVAVGLDDLVLGPADARPVLDGAVTRAAVLQTAYIVGSAHSVLAITNQYAKDRTQFGVPIGSYQAVQYMVSDILIALHTVDLLGRQAAYRVSAGLPHQWEAEIAVVQGKVAAAHLHRQAHEVHAGVGFMLEHPLTVFSRRSKFLENHLGDASYHYDRIAELLCDRPDGGR